MLARSTMAITASSRTAPGAGTPAAPAQQAPAASNAPVEPVEAVGLDGDLLEAQAFAYLAVRSLYGLPLTFPGTTGVREAVTGGILEPANKKAPE